MNAQKTRPVHYIALATILGIAAFFRVYNIDAVGYGNLYYASTVYSMLSGVKNFFFASFDPGGFVSVDKPPLGFWIQSISASIFGFQGWALLLPQILAGVLACLLLYWLVRRYYGPNAALIAALILAVTPIAVATDRNNTIDAQLVLVLLLAAVTVILASEKGSVLWLLAGAALIGIGFNIKMLQAYMILPVFYGFYLLTAHTSWFRKFAHLGLATLLMVLISFAWVAVVDLTPADQRPYVGSSQNNTETELITGHNGLERMGEIAAWVGLKSQTSRPDGGLASGPLSNRPPFNGAGAAPQGSGPFQGPALSPNASPFPGPRGNGNTNRPFPPAGGGQGQAGGPNAGGGPGPNETGTPSITRLFNEQLVGQVSWLLPLALFMLLILGLRDRLAWPLGKNTQFALFWGLWLIPMAVFFSYAGLFHRYYLEMLAPAVGALVGAGLITLYHDFVEGRLRGWLLPFAIMVGAAFEAIVIAAYFSDWADWLIPVILLGGTVAANGSVLIRLLPVSRKIGARLVLAIGLVALLAAPIVWSTTPLNSGDVALPHAGPDIIGRSRSNANFANYTTLTDYLQSNSDGETYLVAAARANTLAPIILTTGQPVMAFGGFTGDDPILTVDQFQSYVQRGAVRYVLLGNDRRGGSVDIESWVQSSCKRVAPRLWQGASNVSQGSAPDDLIRLTLYDCK